MPWTTPGTATAGDVLTAAFWNTNVRDNTNELYSSIKRIGYQSRGSFGSANFYTATSAAIASCDDVFTDITWTADGTSAYVVEFYCPMMIMGAANVAIQANVVTSTGTNLGCIAEVYNASAITAAVGFARYLYTPSAGAAGVNIRARVTSGASGALRFGGDYTNGYLAVYGPHLT